MKKTLLIAVAALGLGGIAAQAQVYSQNIVGYANVPTPSSGVNYLLSVPFKIGVSNGANEVFGVSLPDLSEFLIWNSGSASYVFAKTDAASSTGFSDASDSEIPAPVLPVGMGFFLKPAGANVTNTFAGAIAINVGTTNTMTLPSSGVNYLVGPVVPYAGSVTNGADAGGGLNLKGAGIPDLTEVLIWDSGSASYIFAKTDSASSTGWSDASDSEIAPPSISVGQGFFMKPAAANLQWNNGL